MDLESYINDTTAMLDGVWVEIAGANFLLGKMDNRHYRKAVRELRANDGRKEEPANQDEAMAWMVDAFVGTVLLGWRDVKIGGEDLEYSDAIARRVLHKFPRLVDELMAAAINIENFRNEDLQKEIDGLVPFFVGPQSGGIAKISSAK